MSQITEFLPQLQQLNVIYSACIEHDDLDWKTYRSVVDFYYAHRDVGQFEKMLLDILFEKDKQTGAVVLASLKSELDKNIGLYNQCDALFCEIEPDAISDDIELTYDKEIEGLVRQLNNYGSELCKAVDVIDANIEKSKAEDVAVWKRYEAALANHQAVTEQLYELYQKQKECREEAQKYYINPFADICDLCELFRSIVGKYLPDEIKTDTPPVVPTVAPTTPSAGDFDMGLVSDIHKLCNGAQFEEVSELEFYALLNNQPCSVLLKIKSGEKIRVCYLIHRLSERLKGASRADWRNEMLRKLDISEGYYSSKYKEPESEIPSRKSEEFAKELKSIFE